MGLRSPTSISGQVYLPYYALTRAITPGRPTTAHMTILIDDGSEQVSRDMQEGEAGPEAFFFLLRSC